MPNKRKTISLRTKLAATLLKLGDVPYEHAKLMSEDQIISLYHFDHNILHAIEVNDLFWNLAPMLIKPHRDKSRGDTSRVAKTVRIEKTWQEFTRAMNDGRKPDKRPSKTRWPKRSFSNARNRRT